MLELSGGSFNARVVNLGGLYLILIMPVADLPSHEEIHHALSWHLGDRLELIQLFDLGLEPRLGSAEVLYAARRLGHERA